MHGELSRAQLGILHWCIRIDDDGRNEDALLCRFLSQFDLMCRAPLTGRGRHPTGYCRQRLGCMTLRKPEEGEGVVQCILQSQADEEWASFAKNGTMVCIDRCTYTQCMLKRCSGRTRPEQGGVQDRNRNKIEMQQDISGLPMRAERCCIEKVTAI